MNKNAIWALLLLGIFFYLSQSTQNTVIIQQDSSNVNLADLVDADVSFTGVNKYVTGTSLTGELVRVFRFDGTTSDLGTKSLNSGALSVKPETDYKFYFFMNATGPTVNYYVDVQDYTAKIQDAVDNIIGQGCAIDTKPLITVRNPTSIVQTSRTNAYAMSASQTYDFEIDIYSHSDKCYGTPKAPKGNAVCFGYDATDFSNVKSNTNSISILTSVSSLTRNSDQDTLKCYEFGLLEDGQRDTLTVTVTSNGDPSHNISIFTDDIGFDLNAETLEEIWDYNDESRNQLSRIINSTPDAYIFVN